jgi:hypothetical protein
MTMNIDDLLGTLMGLFEKKLAFQQAMGEREMSLKEKAEANKTDVEYKKLENQLTTDKDKLKWEKEKLTTAIKGDYDLQTLKNNGMLDTERLKGLNEKEKQKIVEEGLNRRADQTNRTEQQKGYLTTLGTVLGHAQEVSQTDVDGKTMTKHPTAEVGTAARSLMEQSGLTVPAATPPTRNVAGEAEVAAEVLREHEKAGTTDAARNYLNTLPPDTRQAALALLNPGGAATAPAPSPTGAPVPGVTPAAPAQPAIQTPVVEPIRPPVQPTNIFQKAGMAARSFMNLRAEDAASAEAQRAATAESVKNLPGTITDAARATTKAVAGAGRDFMTGYDPEAEKKRQEALRRARGLTVGGF